MIRETPLGQLLRACGFRNTFSFPEETEGFQIAPTKPLDSGSDTRTASSASLPVDEAAHAALPGHTFGVDHEKIDPEATRPRPRDAASERGASPQRESTEEQDEPRNPAEAGLRRSTSHSEEPATTKKEAGADAEFILVDWYSDTDAENPRNWTVAKKAWVTTIICYYTFVVYTASAIFVPSNAFIIQRFGVSQELASLGLAMYVAGYGMGPMFFSPLSEIAYVGRNPPYLLSFVLFVVVSIVTAVVADRSFAALIVLRFVQGFFGSPILASGGASLEDMYDMLAVPYAFIFWIAAMYCGPALGPLIAAYAVPHDWRWPLWEIVIMAGPLLGLLPLLPETSRPKILLQRAARLRTATGDARHRSRAEMVKLDTMGIFQDAMIKPIEIALKDPAIGFVCVYGSLVYAIYYSFFEAFPIVYAGTYRMSLGSIGQIFLCVVVGCVVFASAYAAYLYYVFFPMLRRHDMTLESRLRPALPAVFLLPAGLFLFAWTARSDIHWIVPTVGIAIYAGTSFVMFQCIICYVPLTYPAYVASLFAGNDFCRSSLAAGFVMFSRAMYLNLGIDKGVSLLGGLSVMGVLGMWYLYFFGYRLRAKSKFAVG